MAECSPLQRQRRAAVAELDSFFASQPDAHRISGEKRPGAPVRDAWRCNVQIAGEDVAFNVIVDARFPFSLPRLQLASNSRFLIDPHVDERGFLCLTSNQATFSLHRAVELVRYLLGEAKALLEATAAGKVRDDFILEFQSYWERKTPIAAKAFWSLLAPGPPSRTVVVTETQRATLFAESEAAAREWLERRDPKAKLAEYCFHPTAFLWLPFPIWPSEYPRTNKAVAGLAERAGGDAVSLLTVAIPSDARVLPVMLGFETPNGPALGGVRLGTPSEPPIRPGERARPQSHRDGFRAGRMPPELLAKRFFSNTPARLARVERTDAAWIHSRESSDQSASLLREKRVGLIGCGSLGADVALLLAKAGVGKLLLVDEETLSWENIGRHLLGSEMVGRAKAEALAEFLRRQLPHLEVQSEAHAWEEFHVSRPDAFAECDLIVSTTGDWASDAALNFVARSSLRFPPVLFGWTEPHGCAGHALLVADVGGCLGCGCDELGHFIKKVTHWPEGREMLRRAAACGHFFQPYGAVDVGPLKAVIAERALDSLLRGSPASTWSAWVGSLERLRDLGGELTPYWLSTSESGYAGARVVSAAWPMNPVCALCR